MHDQVSSYRSSDTLCAIIDERVVQMLQVPHAVLADVPGLLSQADAARDTLAAAEGQQGADSAAREQALSETATGCYRLITARLAPTVQRWLKTLAKVRSVARHRVVQLAR